jgi:PLP dependent protein
LKQVSSLAADRSESQEGQLPTAEREALAQRLLQVRGRIAQAARQAGRLPDEITLIGVSKFFPAEMARAAVEFGLKDLGENRVQEMLVKIDCLDALGLHPNWHLIGTLQTNKARQVVGRTHLIHSVDSIGLLDEIASRSQRGQQTTSILLQVNTAGEATKHGFEPDDLPAAAEKALCQPGVRLCGLMTMAPLLADPDDTLPVFDQTRELFEKLRAQIGSQAAFSILSMGMSHDFSQAIRCGATHVRIGTAIFGSRL